MEVMRELGHDNLTLKQFVKLLRYGRNIERQLDILIYQKSFRKDPNNFYKNAEEVLTDAKNIIEKKIEPKLLKFFHTKPNAKLEIKGKVKET